MVPWANPRGTVPDSPEIERPQFSPSWGRFILRCRTGRPCIQARLKPLIRKTQLYAKKIAHKRSGWSLAEIEYRAKSAEGKVRHPFFKGLREGL